MMIKKSFKIISQTVYKIEWAQWACISLHNIKICAGKHLIVFKCEEKSIWALGKQKIKQRLVANINLLHIQNKKYNTYNK